MNAFASTIAVSLPCTWRHPFTAVLLWAIACCAPVVAQDPTADQQMQQFAMEITQRHDLPRARVDQVLAAARVQQRILELIASPAEGIPWHEYRAIFLTAGRVADGVEFWREHESILQAVEQRYGVPPQIIAGIIGVETRYGSYMGSHRVIDALTTLAFNYPPRARFFRAELEQYFLLVEEENMDPLKPIGSYAGAMGMPQFISSSYRRFAVDFDNDGRRDLWGSPADIIGSVANYFSEHGWRRGAPVTAPATVFDESYTGMLAEALKPEHTLGELRHAGVQIAPTWPDGLEATLMELELSDGVEHWVGLHNFYVITRYNHSPLYAMAVYQLGQEILAARLDGDGKPE